MYGVKRINKSCPEKLLYQSTWLIENTVRYQKLTITPNARLIAPEGKFLTLTVGGIGRDIAPETYLGDVVITLGDICRMAPHSLMRQNDISVVLSAAVVVSGKSAQVQASELAQGGRIDENSAENVYFGTTAESYNGIVITGDADYTVKGCTFDFEGFSNNDFIGVGAGVLAIDDAKVQIDDCDFNFQGVTRCPVHAGGASQVTANRCRMTNFSPDTDWVGDFSWQVALIGTNRLCQLADGAKATYNDCDLMTNGWGVCSIDGTNAPVELTINNCRVRLVGPRAHGYGAFCIGDNRVTIKDSDVTVNGYPMMVMGMKGEGRPSILGSKIRGRRFGAMVYSDTNSVFEIHDSEFNTGKSTLCVKGSSTKINISNTKMTPGNGTVLQLMDTDECGMNAANFIVPVGETDNYVTGRDLSYVSEADDVIVSLTDMEVRGNFFNSTTNLLANKRSTQGGKGLFHDTMAGLAGMDDGAEPPAAMPPMPPMAEGAIPMMKDNSGPKNLGLTLKNAAVEGAISSALQAYRDGLTEITAANRLELGNITQTAAPTVNNGVVLTMDGSSRWAVTKTCYITALNLAPGAIVTAAEGKTLSVTVDGEETKLVPGAYKGKIVLTVA